MNQIELENKYHRIAVERTEANLAKNEQDGRADSNPYATAIFKRYVLPLADLIAEAKAESKSHTMSAGVGPLLYVDDVAAAHISIRAALTFAMQGQESQRVLMAAIGKDIYRECILTKFANEKPENYAAISADLMKKASRDPNHRTYVMRKAMHNEGVEIPEWDLITRGHVGQTMIHLMTRLGFLELSEIHIFNKKHALFNLTDHVQDQVDSLRGSCLELMPYKMPFVERPLDWTTNENGGFHTAASRSLSGFAISGGRRGNYTDEDTANTRAAMNILQGTQWAVNTELLDWIPKIAHLIDTKEIPLGDGAPQPARPDFCDTVAAEDMTEEQALLFKKWKKAMAIWYSAQKKRKPAANKAATTIRLAKEFAEYDRIYFMYQADTRGRLYSQSVGMHPQGSDLSKALLHFSRSMPLGQTGQDWFLIHGANTFGEVDKDSFQVRIQWCLDNQEAIKACASDPLACRWWLDADKPYMFLAWCFEAARYFQAEDKAGFESRIPVGMDGSCNGLQHYSAALRDKIGGKAVNLVPGKKPEDVYGQVANVVKDLVQAHPDCPERTLWLQHGITRKLTKRSVMTLVYGAKKVAVHDKVFADYFKSGDVDVSDLPQEMHFTLSKWISPIIWEGISRVVVAARAGMDWMQQASRIILKDGTTNQIVWYSPSGLKVVQNYRKLQETVLTGKLYQGQRLRVYTPTDKADKVKAANGIAPNFVHSLDAAHMTMTIIAAHEAGIEDLAFVHDDYGCHACNCAELGRILREKFLDQYVDHDPFGEFVKRYPQLPSPPERGELDLSVILDSPYFFA